MKQLCLFTIIIVTISSFTYSSLTEIANEKTKLHMNAPPAHTTAVVQPPKKDLTGTMLWEGWVRYFHFHSGQSSDRPTNFFINNDYFSQKVQVTQRSKKDKHGYVYIPTKFEFYMAVLNKSLLVLSSRNIPITRASDRLSVEFINKVEKNRKLKGPIKDMGKFREGYCVSLMATVPITPSVNYNPKDGVSENWVICVQNLKQQKKLLEVLVQSKLYIQAEKEEEKKEMEHVKHAVSISDALTPKPTAMFETLPDATLLDGYLLLLKDWSQCTLKCGGGWSYQQWMCVPPKKGGRPCKGDLIRKKPCNTKPCPGTKHPLAPSPLATKIPPGIKQIPGDVLKPIIKSLPISTRPQQFLTCVIKESDVLLEAVHPETNKSEKLPARLIMNKRSISLYKDDKLTQSAFNFRLDKMNIYPDDKDLCCFQIASDNKKFKVCAFGEDCGDENNRKFVEGWQRDINLFKTRCFHELKQDAAEKSVGKTPEFDNNILGSMGLSTDEASARHDVLKKKLAEKAEENFANQLGKTQSIAMQAVKKEIGIEEMIKREFALKAKSEVDKLVKEMQNEQKKKASLERALSDRQIEDAKLRASREHANAIKMLQKEAQQEVMNKRNSLRSKIMEIKKKEDRKKRVLERQISIIRGQMTRALLDANRAGSMKKCQEAYGNKEKITRYCNNNVVDDFKKNEECKEGQSFCYICCENEYGNMHILERDECYDMCDKMLAKQLDSGNFIWA